MLKDIQLKEQIIDISNTLEEALIYVQQKLWEESCEFGNLNSIIQDVTEGIESIKKVLISLEKEIYDNDLIYFTETLKNVVEQIFNYFENKDLMKSRSIMEEEIVEGYNKWRNRIDNEFLNENIYSSNIESLINRHGEILKDNLNNCFSSTKVEANISKDKCIINLIKNGETNYINDKYSLKYDEDYFKKDNILIVYGFGMGYYVYELFKTMGKNNYLLIIEPDINIFNKALQFNKFVDLFSSENVYLTIGNDIDNVRRIAGLVLNYKNKKSRNSKLIINDKYGIVYNEFHNSCLNEIKKIISLNHPNFFPLMTEDKTYIGNPILQNKKGEAYYTSYYNEVYEDFPTSLWSLYKTETLYGEKYTKPNINIKGFSKSILPILALESNSNLKLKINNKQYDYKKVVSNNYNYYPINEDCNINIRCDKDIVLGKPIQLVQNKKHKVKLVLNIFIDGLAKYALGKETIREQMPNTTKFFEKGAKFNNCYANGEWTLPSVPTLFSGKYACKHKMYHPNAIPFNIGHDYPILSEHFQNEDYHTFQICGDWRKNPIYGYVKGFDRTIYKRAMNYKDIIFTFLEQMRTFKNRDQFGWISFFDMHDLTCPIPDISNQVENSLEAHDYVDNDEKSVYKDYDGKRSEIYINKLKQLDYYLKIIYDYIEQNFKDEEILIVFCTDHGQAYLGKDKHELSDSRTEIPLLMRGRGIPSMEINELVENVDAFPTILDLCDIKLDNKSIDGRIPEALGGDKQREYVYSESIFPQKTFKAVIRDKKHKFLFETEENVLDDGRVKIGKFSTKLINLSNGKEESNVNREKIDRYTDVVLSNIKNITIIDKNI